MQPPQASQNSEIKSKLTLYLEKKRKNVLLAAPSPDPTTSSPTEPAPANKSPPRALTMREYGVNSKLEDDRTAIEKFLRKSKNSAAVFKYRIMDQQQKSQDKAKQAEKFLLSNNTPGEIAAITGNQPQDSAVHQTYKKKKLQEIDSGSLPRITPPPRSMSTNKNLPAMAKNAQGEDTKEEDNSVPWHKLVPKGDTKKNIFALPKPVHKSPNQRAAFLKLSSPTRDVSYMLETATMKFSMPTSTVAANTSNSRREEKEEGSPRSRNPGQDIASGNKDKGKIVE